MKVDNIEALSIGVHAVCFDHEASRSISEPGEEAGHRACLQAL